MKQTYAAFSYKTLHIMRRIISKFKAVLPASYFFKCYFDVSYKKHILVILKITKM